jgi:hypothetical protein
MNRIATFASLVLALASAPVVAGGKPAPASQHKPPIVLDEASVYVKLVQHSDNGYGFNSYVEIAGLASNKDAARLDWKQGGKVLATSKCELSFEARAATHDFYATGHCKFSDNVKATGAVEAELVVRDDQDDKEYLVRTFKMTVRHYKGLAEDWQVSPDDVLAAAWIYHGHGSDDDSRHSGSYRRPNLYMWFTGDWLNDGALRCTVAGKKVPDVGLSRQSDASETDIEFVQLPKGGKRVRYVWSKQIFLLDVYWGKRDTLASDLGKNVEPDHVLADNPGKWECALRHDGKAIRQLNFTVDADGMIQQDEIQSGKNAIPTVSNLVVLVDLRLTKDSATYDARIAPEAMKKSLGFGLPWPDHPKVKTIHASYPAKSGLPDPK